MLYNRLGPAAILPLLRCYEILPKRNSAESKFAEVVKIEKLPKFYKKVKNGQKILLNVYLSCGDLIKQFVELIRPICYHSGS